MQEKKKIDKQKAELQETNNQKEPGFDGNWYTDMDAHLPKYTNGYRTRIEIKVAQYLTFTIFKLLTGTKYQSRKEKRKKRMKQG